MVVLVSVFGTEVPAVPFCERVSVAVRRLALDTFNGRRHPVIEAVAVLLTHSFHPSLRLRGTRS